MSWRARACIVPAALILVLCLPASAESPQGLYRVDLSGVGSCYDADLSLMLPGHVYAYLEPGALEMFFPQPPSGISRWERVILLGDETKDFAGDASRYIAEAVLGRDVLLAFDAVSRNSAGALLAYAYLPDDGTCVNLKLIRDGCARVVAPGVSFQFREEFDMYEQQARDKRKGIWH